jgi:hypothetical protein
MTARSSRWSAEEDARLVIAGEFLTSRLTEWQDLARKSFPNRTTFAMRVRYSTLCRKAEGLEPKRRVSRGARGTGFRVEREAEEATALARVEAARSLQHHSIGAEMFGDPLPGRSALDKRNAGVGA